MSHYVFIPFLCQGFDLFTIKISVDTDVEIKVKVEEGKNARETHQS